MLSTKNTRYSRGGLADMCAKVVGGALQEGCGFPIHVCFYIFERECLKQNCVKVYWGWLPRANTVHVHADSCRFKPSCL